MNENTGMGIAVTEDEPPLLALLVNEIRHEVVRINAQTNSLCRHSDSLFGSDPKPPSEEDGKAVADVRPHMETISDAMSELANSVCSLHNEVERLESKRLV